MRQAREEGSDLQLIGGDGISVEDCALIAGSADSGSLFTSSPDPVEAPEAGLPMVRLGRSARLSKTAFRAYAAVEAWAQAADRAGTINTEAIAETLHTQEFETVLGRSGFDEKGDLTGRYGTVVWYTWSEGHHVPLEHTIAKEQLSGGDRPRDGNLRWPRAAAPRSSRRS